MSTPKAFLSYSWDDDTHKDWVRVLAERLRSDGVETILDHWELAPGDQLPAFMERAVRESDFVLIVCTPRYKERSERRVGGVGYEGDIMTAEVMTTQNQRKFVPVLRIGDWIGAAPSWLAGKYYIDLNGSPYSEAQYQDLLTTLHGRRAAAPPVKNDAVVFTAIGGGGPVEDDLEESNEFQPLKIEGIVVDEVGEPRNDGTRGSALYDVPFQLSSDPPPEWSEVFIHSWNSPPRFTSMHRPGIASVVGDRIILDGTTVDEVQKYHRDTLILVVEEANKRYQEYAIQRRQQAQAERDRRRQHRSDVADTARKIRFD